MAERIRISMKEASRATGIEITVSGIRRFTFRLHVAMLLIRLGCWIMPIETTITDTGEPDDG